MVGLPPGTLLQLMYLDERLRAIKPGHFIEVGPGSGTITALLLRRGWSGTVYDLNQATLENLRVRFSNEVQTGRLNFVAGDFLESPPLDRAADLLISCMVMEHMNDVDEVRYMEKAKHTLSTRGLMIGLVPSNPADWGIEDEIAGHFRRYTRASLQTLTEKTDWVLDHVAGLTFPVSNILLPISNYLVRKEESAKLTLPSIERTKLSGQRHVQFKTHFPSILNLILNPLVLWPFHFLQKRLAHSNRALVLYFEGHCRHHG